jgi:hypothetical protein
LRFRALDAAKISYSRAVTVFTKSDELLPSYEKFIARLIFNVHPSYLDALGPFTERITKYLSTEVWCKAPKEFCRVNGKIFRCYFACGATSKDLNSFVDSVKAMQGIGLIVMGDDTWAVDTTTVPFTYIECDFSKFDATQSDALRGLWLQFLKDNGFHDYAKVWKALYRESVVYRHRRENKSFDVPKIPMLLTGEPGTCVRNSFSNILVSAHALADVNPMSVYEKAGLLAKLKTGPSHYRTFLRGVFLQTPSGVSWTKLPSFLLKFGKMLTDAKLIYPKTWSAQRAIHQAVYSQWMGYGAFINNWFYSRLDKKIRSLCYLATESAPLIKDQYKVFSQGEVRYVDDIEFNMFCMERYNVPIALFEDFCAFFDSIEGLPCMYSHKLLDVFEKVDY